MADPALAAWLLRVTRESLLDATNQADRLPRYQKLRKGPLLGNLFEALVALSIRVYAQPLGLEIAHLRTHGGLHEVDIIIERPDGRVLAFEVKLAESVGEDDVSHLHWLRDRLSDDLIDAVVVTTGTDAYRRPDGIAVVPLALLGP